MIFSGINSREIARKNEVSFRANVRPSNIFGKAEIGFSGVGGVPVRFHLESGICIRQTYSLSGWGFL